MNKENSDFIEEGIKRYKQATYVLVKFKKEIEKQLQSILNTNTKWGKFTPEQEALATSTTYGAIYPLLNARVKGTLLGQKVIIVIAISWYQSETEYPLYAVWIEPKDKQLELLLNNFVWSDDYKIENGALRLYPDPRKFDLERDFSILLNEFGRFLETVDSEEGAVE